MAAPRAVPSSTEDRETHVEPEAKRRKIRKGTRSCWECKRRKMKCIFGSATDPLCINCQQRGTTCISQEFPEEIVSPRDTKRKIGDRVVRVENLVEQLIKKVGNDEAAAGRRASSEDGGHLDHGIPTPASTDSRSSRFLTLSRASEIRLQDENDAVDVLHGGREPYEFRSVTDAPVEPGKYEKLSRALHRSLPSRGDIETICKACGHRSSLLHEILTLPYATLDQNGLKPPESLLEIPRPDVHPVLLARYMLHLATFLQNLDPELHKEGLSESPQTIFKRLVNIASSLVTTNDELLGSIEGLECVMIESYYQANGGNLRRSWVASRRAMTIAHLMGLHRPASRAQYKVLDPETTKVDPGLMWFRIVFYDRHLCLMLGLPQGSLDRSMASDAVLANDTPMGRLERIHCVIASRILERNDSDQSSYDLIQTLDMELQRAARRLPSKWWLTPSLDSTVDDPQTLFWDMRRLFAQLFHYNMLIQLHLPYMLRSTADRKYDYSRITGVNASREMLSRFMMLRSFNRTAFSCRIVDFLAHMAAMTLLLAHLDSHRSSQADNLLAHQYLSDRAMIEQAQENMQELSRLNADALSTQSADLLRRLLAIEAEAADGHIPSTDSVSVHGPDGPGTEMAQPDEDNDSVVRVHIPYFGIIKIAREGVISKEMPKPQPPPVASITTTQNPLPAAAAAGRSNITTNSEIPQADVSLQSSSMARFSGIPNVEIIPPISVTYPSIQDLPSSTSYTAPHPPLPHFPNPAALLPPQSLAAPQFQRAAVTSNDSLVQQQYESPGLIAGVDDWAFQGVDMAFFDSLMRSAGNDDEEVGNNGGAVEGEWATWQNEG